MTINLRKNLCSWQMVSVCSQIFQLQSVITNLQIWFWLRTVVKVSRNTVTLKDLEPKWRSGKKPENKICKKANMFGDVDPKAAIFDLKKFVNLAANNFPVKMLFVFTCVCSEKAL